MKKINLFKIVLLVAILIIAFLCRYKNYTEVPVGGTSMDEYSYSWVGLSLLKVGYPVGISGISGYKNNDFKYVNPDGLANISVSGPMVFNYPWFDHPPALPLLTGTYSVLRGVNNFEEVQLRIIRQPMIILGVLSVGLLFALLVIIFDFNTALLSSLIYATAPISVVGSRMVQGENGLIPCWLASLVCLSLFIKNKKIFYLFLTGILAGLSILFKLSGVVALLSGVLLLWFLEEAKEKKINILVLLIMGFSFLSLFFIYGYYFDWQIFKNILFSNSARFYGLGPNLFSNLLIQAKLTNDKNIFDAWILVGWVSWLGLLGKKGKKYLWLVIPVLSYLMVYIFFGSYNYGWYTFPFLPFLAASFGVLIGEIFKKRQFLRLFLMMLLPIGAGILSLVSLDKFQPWSRPWRIFVPLTILGLLFPNISKKGKLIPILLLIMFGVGICLNIVYVWKLNADFWYASIW